MILIGLIPLSPLAFLIGYFKGNKTKKYDLCYDILVEDFLQGILTGILYALFVIIVYSSAVAFWF